MEHFDDNELLDLQIKYKNNPDVLALIECVKTQEYKIYQLQQESIERAESCERGSL